MIGNYFKVAARNVGKRKFYSFINAFGLSIGLAFCMLIALYIQDEKDFDRFHENKNSIFRIEEKSFDTWQHNSDNPFNHSAWIQTGLAPAIKEELPEVKYATRYSSGERGIFRYEDKVFTEEVAYVDAGFGLAGINAVNRTKEIGIRKVMGADLPSIFILLNRQFILLAFVAFCLAAPLSWWFITTWYLKEFIYKAAFGWELFALSMGTGLLLALATVSYHAIKAALINPADTLKYE